MVFVRGPGRPRRGWRLQHHGGAYYKPQGVPLTGLDVVTVSLEEANALRLVDDEGLDQQSASERLGISQPTLNRSVKSARHKVARALTHGLALRIRTIEESEIEESEEGKKEKERGGGESMPQRDGTGPEGRGPKTGWGQGTCPPSKEGEKEEGEKTGTDEARPATPPFWGGRGRGFGPGRGFGRGAGRGRGRGWRW